jgi:hypothetical protein
MSKLVAVLMAGIFSASSFAAIAADEPVTPTKKAVKPAAAKTHHAKAHHTKKQAHKKTAK